MLVYKGVVILGSNIKILRAQKGSTQQQVADFCNIALRTYQRIEHGERSGDISLWQKLARYFDTTIDTLLAQDINESQGNSTK